ncbi:MAG: LysM domain/M23/M37 peptidase domain-containing protein [Parcubacteria group bacterium GW2011_GWA2_40_37]|nr:MAG: LysM domain/M23/M37 peptidase domain-containing protein [Parcubacteria group bacterium GW2011_GWA2_40_37]
MPLFLGLFWLLAISTQAEAGFPSSIFLGPDANAQVNLDSAQSSKNLQLNSQTMDLLRANVSSASILENKNDKKGDNKDQIDPSANINIVSDTAMLPATGPMGVSGGRDVPDTSSLETSVYVIRKGDTLSSIAEMFGVSVDTILSANDMNKGDKLKEGDTLLILPFDAVEHPVAKGETLNGIAIKYKVDLEDILDANNIDANTKLVVGERLIIPGAEMLSENAPRSVNPSVTRGGSQIYTVAPGYFVNPVPGARRTRGITKAHNGVDLAAPKGTPILAAASGTVVIARNGYNGGFGNYVVIQHPNGTKTLYAHMSKLGTTPGAQVSQGEMIGRVGNTGRSRGDHAHVEVLGGKNPL